MIIGGFEALGVEPDRSRYTGGPTKQEKRVRGPCYVAEFTNSTLVVKTLGPDGALGRHAPAVTELSAFAGSPAGHLGADDRAGMPSAGRQSADIALQTTN